MNIIHSCWWRSLGFITSDLTAPPSEQFSVIPQLQVCWRSYQHQPPISITMELDTVFMSVVPGLGFPASIQYGWCKRSLPNDSLRKTSSTAIFFFYSPLVNLKAFWTSYCLSSLFSLYQRSNGLTHPWLMTGRVWMGGVEKRRAGMRIWLISHMTSD